MAHSIDSSPVLVETVLAFRDKKLEVVLLPEGTQRVARITAKRRKYFRVISEPADVEKILAEARAWAKRLPYNKAGIFSIEISAKVRYILDPAYHEPTPIVSHTLHVRSEFPT